MYPILTLDDKVSVILAICDIKEENQGDLELAKVKCKAEKSNTKARRGSILFVTHNFPKILYTYILRVLQSLPEVSIGWSLLGWQSKGVEYTPWQVTCVDDTAAVDIWPPSRDANSRRSAEEDVRCSISIPRLNPNDHFHFLLCALLPCPLPGHPQPPPENDLLFKPWVQKTVEHIVQRGTAQRPRPH